MKFLLAAIFLIGFTTAAHACGDSLRHAEASDAKANAGKKCPAKSMPKAPQDGCVLKCCQGRSPMISTISSSLLPPPSGLALAVQAGFTHIPTSPAVNIFHPPA